MGERREVDQWPLYDLNLWSGAAGSTVSGFLEGREVGGGERGGPMASL